MDIALLNAIPFLAAIIVAIPALRTTVPKALITYGTTAVMAVLFVAFLGYLPLVQEQGAIEHVIPWVPGLGLTLTFYLDGLSLLFALVVTGVGTLICFYAGPYFDTIDEQARFMSPLLAFAGAMLGVVLSGNIFALFIAWEMTSITSFLLIGFKGDKYEAARFGARQALVITGAGALAMIGGLVLLAIAAGQINNPDATGFVMNAELSTILSTEGLGEHPWYAAFTILIMLGAFTKSAQFPFHFWLPGAMSAPTPASAYLHSATMVKAGVYLLARMYPPLHDNPLWTSLLVGVGLVTWCMGAYFAVGNRDLKGMLAYTTISKLGALVALIGLPDYLGIKAAMVGIVAHAAYKAALFLITGTIDHAYGTRVIDKLGGIWREMPWVTVIAVISALSMAGVPFFFGFVSKEVFIDAVYLGEIGFIPLLITMAGAVFTSIAAYILIWEVFFRKPKEGEEPHIHHPMSPLIDIPPGVLAFISLTFGFLIDPVVIPLIDPAVPKDFKLVLFPGFTFVFGLSIFAVTFGFIIFLVRKNLMVLFSPPLLTGTYYYNKIIWFTEWVSDQSLRLQGGRVRYYLTMILGVLAAVFIGSGLLANLDQGQSIPPEMLVLTSEDALKAMLVFLAIAAAGISIWFREHLMAALSLGVMGYAIGGLFLLEPAPDVALVQLLVETLATVLLIIMIGRISAAQRKDAMNKVFKGQAESGIGIWLDGAIAFISGFSVFVFALTAVLNRPARESISSWHIDNALALVGVQDIVGAIVADFRAMDTVLEIGVFAVAALGVLTLLSRGRQQTDPMIPSPANIKKYEEFDQDAIEEVQDATRLSTPFTRGVALLVLPFSLLIAISQIVYGSGAPGDGFTAGSVAGLAIALWYVVFGYDDARERLGRFIPSRLVRLGLTVATINAILPMFLGGAFLGYFAYDKALGIDAILSLANLKFTTTVIFEIAIALTVSGGIGVIMEAIAYPARVRDIDRDDEADPIPGAPQPQPEILTKGDA